MKSNKLKTYTSAQKRFLDFCTLYQLEHLPAMPETILLYVAFLHKEGLKGSTVKVYLAPVSNLHLKNDYIDPCANPRVKLAVKGAINLSSAPIRKLPIPFDVLSRLSDLLDGRNNGIMLKLAMSMAFYGCMRAGELCDSDNEHFDPRITLTWGDLSCDPSKKSLNLFVKRSKTDYKNEGVSIRMGCSCKTVCAFCAFLERNQKVCQI